MIIEGTKLEADWILGRGMHGFNRSRLSFRDPARRLPPEQTPIPDILKGKTPEQFIASLYVKTPGFSSYHRDCLLFSGHIQKGGWRFNFRNYLKAFDVIRSGVKQKAYAPNEETLINMGITLWKPQDSQS